MKRSHNVKTVSEVRAEFAYAGRSFAGWAREHGFKSALVFEVLRGRIKGSRGKSHEIAVLLGLKHGEIQQRKAA